MTPGNGKREAGSVRTGVVVVMAILAACRGEPAASARIVEPADGAQFVEPQVRVVLEAAGIEIAPAVEERSGTAHHHLFLDTDPMAAGDTIPAGTTGIIHLGRGQTEFTFDSLAPGAHRLIAVLADAWHVVHASWRTDTTRFTVAAR